MRLRALGRQYDRGRTKSTGAQVRRAHSQERLSLFHVFMSRKGRDGRGFFRPDNPITETGLRAEISRNGLHSRFGQKRADTIHQVLDPLIIGVPWLLTGGLIWQAVRSLRRRFRPRQL